MSTTTLAVKLLQKQKLLRAKLLKVKLLRVKRLQKIEVPFWERFYSNYRVPSSVARSGKLRQTRGKPPKSVPCLNTTYSGRSTVYENTQGKYRY